ncbi:MAG: hypothetical protein BJ554DRAFT_934 [Olpidium bornovanus]|uniref:Ubiquitin fusion degradation protein UFD1 N-terminal subdomain 2 domain-containing protein n=1 Tax=Olpidium bornovanus TaxID=278681 RepID=A0A8H8DHS8_9FUNG|nr:MAG: hypothetical protein BJ554DRAFT_934 [Olpidium bornovanus]
MPSSFRDIPDVRAAFESALRQFSTLAQDDVLTVFHGGQPYRFAVAEMSPAAACSVVDTDVSVDIIPEQGGELDLCSDPAARARHFGLRQSGDDCERRELLPEVELRGEGLRNGDVHYLFVNNWKGKNGVIKLKLENGDAGSSSGICDVSFQIAA